MRDFTKPVVLGGQLDPPTAAVIGGGPTVLNVAPIGVGVPGPPGKDGSSQNSVTYTQATPAQTWAIAHTLGRYADVTLVVNGETVYTDVDQPDTHTVILTFPTPTAGTVVLD